MSATLKVKLTYEPRAHHARAYPGFCSMKRLGVFLLPPGWDASPSQGYSQHYVFRDPFKHLSGKRHREQCLIQEHNAITTARAQTQTA